MYLALKVIHLLAVIMFFGNIVTGLFWKLLADGSHDPMIIAHALRAIIRLDRWITLPSIVLIVAAGVAAAMAAHLPILGTFWISASIALFTVSGIAFGVWVAPLQARMRVLAEAGATSDSMDWEAYRRLSRRWEFWGAVATLAPAVALVLMVVKPV